MTPGDTGGRVVIAGTGVAAAALACLLRRDGVEVVLLRSGARARRPAEEPTIEAVPEAAVELFVDVGLGDALVAAGAVKVPGFANATDPSGPRSIEGRWVHVPRADLARMCLREARRRGAAVLPVRALGRPVPLDGAGVAVLAGELRLSATAAVDATGRAARWSRPVERAAPATATLHARPGRPHPAAGRLDRCTEGWTYRLEHPRSTTVGVIRPRRHAAAEPLGGGERPTVVCAAGLQWARHPIDGDRIAIGDAALALSPLSGQGLRMALTSALSAAAVLRSRRACSGAAAAEEHYRSALLRLREHHRRWLTDPETGAPEDVASLPGHQHLEWAAGTHPVGVLRHGTVVVEPAYSLVDGTPARWAGGLDLRLLRAVVGSGRTTGELIGDLVGLGTTSAQAQAVLGWALRAGLVRETSGESR